MEYTRDGLKIGLDELRRMLEYAENRQKYGNMTSCIFITYGNKPQIIQYCGYGDCNPIYHTALAKDKRER